MTPARSTPEGCFSTVNLSHSSACLGFSVKHSDGDWCPCWRASSEEIASDVSPLGCLSLLPHACSGYLLLQNQLSPNVCLKIYTFPSHSFGVKDLERAQLASSLLVHMASSGEWVWRLYFLLGFFMVSWVGHLSVLWLLLHSMVSHPADPDMWCSQCCRPSLRESWLLRGKKHELRSTWPFVITTTFSWSDGSQSHSHSPGVGVRRTSYCRTGE